MIEKLKNYQEIDIKDTSFKDKGIYAILIHNQIYIGKSNNQNGMRARWLQHLNEVKKYFKYIEETNSKSLLDGFNQVFASGIYDSKHLYSKITKTLIDHNLKIDDIKFYKIESKIETYNEIELDSLEQKYIKEFDSIKKGFNQLNLISDYFKLQNSLRESKNTNKPNNYIYKYRDINHIKQHFFELIDYIKTVNRYALSDKPEDAKIINNWEWSIFNVTNGLKFLEEIVKIYKQVKPPNNQKNDLLVNQWSKNLVKEMDTLYAIMKTLKTFETFEKLEELEQELSKTPKKSKTKNKEEDYEY